MAPAKRTKFNPRWMDKASFPQFSEWLCGVKDDVHSAHCIECKSNFSLSNMGIGAIKCHANGSEHKSIIRQKSSQSSISSFLTVQSGANQSCNSITSANSGETQTAQLQTQTQSSIQLFTTNDDTLKAEILWAMTVVEKKLSLNSCSNISKLFKCMFPDSGIAHQFQLGKDKASYIIHYGISHYFHETLLDTLKNCSDITICFDESFNKIAQKEQMDLIVRFWKGESVCSRYYGSVFLGRSTAQDLLDSFIKALADIPLSKLCHVSMDGPNVNLSFLGKLEEHLSNEYPDGKRLIKIGTCGLHVVHGAMKTGLKSVDWNIFTLLRHLYYLFSYSPAKRAEFTRITGCEIFPKKFCEVRWLENSDCIGRAIELVEPITKYLSQVKQTNGKLHVSLQTSMRDPLIKCKLAFVKSLSLQCETFLTNFQSEKVRVPYLYEELSQLLRGIMIRFVKPDKLGEVPALLKLDLDSKDNLLDVKKIDIGFGANKYLRNIKVAESIKLSFLRDCKKILQNLVKKITDKSPVKYKLVKGLSSLHPAVVLNNTGLVRFNTVLQVLYDANRINETEAEKAKVQYKSFCSDSKEKYKEEFQSILTDNTKLEIDSFYYKILSNKTNFEELWKVVKICFLISHGNSDVERGFSVNKEMLVENLKEQSLINQRRAYDGIKFMGGAENISINKRMLLAVRGARHRYRDELSKRKKFLNEEALEIKEKRKLENELQLLENQKKRIRLEKQKEECEIEEKIRMLTEKKKSFK